MYFTYIMGLSFGQFLPTITKTLGFSTTITLVMTFPPWAFATLFALANSWHSDRTGEKFWHIALSYGFAILGYIVALTGQFDFFCRYGWRLIILQPKPLPGSTSRCSACVWASVVSLCS